MKKQQLLFCFIFCLLKFNVWAQLSSAAQLLYDSAFAQDPSLVSYASSNGAQVFSTPDSSSFYVQWFPPGATPSATPLIVSLHGSHCNAFMEFKSWYPRAQLAGCGIIAFQWYRYRPMPPLDYFPDDTLYSYIEDVLGTLNYPSNKALLHGFSRGSARSYSMIFNDIRTGNNYFCTTISNSGDADPGYPLYDSINSGAFGTNVFAGKHWNLFCGNNDTIVGCAKMNATQTWLQSQGATVDIFIQDPVMGHNGFQLPSSFAYKDSILNNYLQCYGGTTETGNTDRSQQLIIISPNPFVKETRISTTGSLEGMTLSVYNCLGQEMKQLNGLHGKEVLFSAPELPEGVYFLVLSGTNSKTSANKVLIRKEK